MKIRWRVGALITLRLSLAACGAITDTSLTAPALSVIEGSPTLHFSPAPLLTSSPAPLLSHTPSPPLTNTPAPPCDPRLTFCIESGHFLFQRPIALPDTDTVDPTYRYGSTQTGTRQPHHGVEFYNASGTPVLAAAEGAVVYAGDDKQTLLSPWPNFYGNLIVIEHHFDSIAPPVFTLYAHLSKIDVSAGQTVAVGEKIGEVGASGAAIGSHLHFEVRLGENNYASNRNPVLWLRPLSGEDGNPYGLIAGRFVDSQGNPIYYTSLNIQYFPDLNAPQAAAYTVETYASEKQPVRGDDQWQENFALSDLPAGNYRISYLWLGVLYERWVEVQPGKVTLATFIIQ